MALNKAVNQSVFIKTKPRTGPGTAHGCTQCLERGGAPVAGAGPTEEAMTERARSQKRLGAHLRSEKTPAGSQARLLSTIQRGLWTAMQEMLRRSSWSKMRKYTSPGPGVSTFHEY